MIDAKQLRYEIIRPVLKHLDPEIPYSMAAENLLMGTCAQESKMGTFLVQLDGGPAMGIFQMEPATHHDIYANYLYYHEGISDKIMDYNMMNGADNPKLLINDLAYAAAMCRVHYYRVPKALPADNVEELANYYKLFYNTPEGKATVQQFIDNYHRFVA